MRIRPWVGGAVLMTMVVAGLARPPYTWVISSSVDLDARIERQIEVMAARDQAVTQFVRATPERPRGASATNLNIELRWEENLDSFRDALGHEAGAPAIAPTAEMARDGYIISAHCPRASAPDHLRVTAVTWRGFHNALLRLPDLLAIVPANLPAELIPHPQALLVERDGVSAVIADFPSFPERGVVEGFYGTPWTHQDRLSILRFEGEHALNAYYYAPKDDPYHRKLWREDYPPEAQRQLGELVDAAEQNFVDFCFAISPGLSMAYSSESDFLVLTHKLESVSRLGVSCFALFLDDVPQDLQDPQDKARFKSLAQAHISLTNRLYRRLKEVSAGNRLVLTPTTYTNEWGNRDYLRELGAGVDPAVSIVWTGPQVYSPSITADQAREWAGYIHRPPLIWDNYPVNDGAPWCRFLGPLTGRDAHLPEAARGLVSNPMNQARASMIPLATIADYLWNAATYDPAQSENRAVTSQYGADGPRLLAPFLKVYATDYWDDGIFTALFKERRLPIDVEKMQSDLTAMTSALEHLQDRPRLKPLLEEIAPAIKRTEERLAEVKADPAFRHLGGGTLAWDENHDAVSAYHLSRSPNLDGNFAKWEKGPIYRLAEAAQVSAGARHWRGPQELSARVALAWDESFLYVGVDVTDPDLYQPFFARGIQNGDAVVIDLEAGFRKNFFATQPTGDEYTLYFSPGDFAGVKPSIFSDEDYLPTRPQGHNYMQEIYTAWKRTTRGYSGDIGIPVNFFAGGKLAEGYEIGLVLSVAKVTRPAHPGDADDLERVVLQSKQDHLFRATARNPSSFPRLVLAQGKP